MRTLTEHAYLFEEGDFTDADHAARFARKAEARHEHVYRLATVCVERDGFQTSACTTHGPTGEAMARAWIPRAQESCRG